MLTIRKGDVEVKIYDKSMLDEAYRILDKLTASPIVLREAEAVEKSSGAKPIPIPSAALPETVSAWINKAGAVPLKGFKAAKYQNPEFWQQHPDFELIRDSVVPITLLEQARYELENTESMEKIEELEAPLKTVCKLLIDAGEYYVDQEKKVHKVPE